MELLKVNHVITDTNTMLKGLVTNLVIEEQDRRNLLPMIVKEIIKRETVTNIVEE